MIFSFSINAFLIQSATANEGEHSSPAAEGAKIPEKEFSGHQNEKWSEVQAELSKLKIKVDVQTKAVEEILLEQKHIEGKVPSEDIEKLKKEHEKLKSLTKDYNEMLSDFQFRFPEKGLESGRKYIRVENQTIEQIESSPSFEARLKKLNQKIKHQYLSEDNADSENSEKSEKKKPAHKTEKIPVGSKGLDTKKTNEPAVTDQINLVK